jgi:PIN domain nuclease of toxin-antitoxin system
MKVLIDTHVFIWWTSEPQKLSPNIYNLLTNTDTKVIFSLASIWEMQIKLSLGKLTFETALPGLVEDELKRNQIELLPINLAHIYALSDLPNHHRDPFDRLLIAQAINEGLAIVSIDEKFDGYDIERLW